MRLSVFQSPELIALSLSATGVLVRLAGPYIAGEPMPTDSEGLRVLAHCTVDEWQPIFDELLVLIRCADGALHLRPFEALRASTLRRSAEARRSAQTRWHRPANVSGQQAKVTVEIAPGSKTHPHRRADFVPPTVAEVETEMMIHVDEVVAKREATAFIDHFASNGWLVSGRAKMKDYQAAARSWLRRSKTLFARAGVAPSRVHPLCNLHDRKYDDCKL